MTANKLERILNLLAELLNAEDRPRSADDLRKRVGMYPSDKAAFRRTFDRDKNALRDMGVPLRIVSVPGTNPPVDGYVVKKSEYYLADMNLTAGELTALNLAVESVEILDGLAESDAIRKLGGYEHNTNTNTLHFPTSDETALPNLFNAISNRQTLEFEYNSTVRKIEPWRLEFANGKWYLTGNNPIEGEVKSFRTDKMTDICVQETFDQFVIPDDPPKVNLQPWSFGKDETIETTLQIDQTIFPWAESNLDINIELGEEGVGIISVDVNNMEAFFDRLVLLLGHAEIIEPETVREAFITRIEQYLKVSDGCT
jgi:predicted DNA-binding transcriptional regulator YafY